MSESNLCKELEEVEKQVEKIVDEAIEKLYNIRDRLAKIIVIDAGLAKEKEDKYGILTTYIDLLNLIASLTSGEASISIDMIRVRRNLGCEEEKKKEGGQ